MTPATKTPPFQNTSPVSCRASEIQPGLVKHGDTPLGPDRPVELRLVAHVRGQPEQVARVGWRQPRLTSEGALGHRTRARAHATARSCPSRSCTCRHRRPEPRRGEAGFARRASASRANSPPYMSVSVSPIDRMRSFTRYAPELVEPPSQTRSAFAASSSEGTIISRRSASTCEPGGGMPECCASTVAAMASLTVDAAGKRALAFHARLHPPVRLWT